MPPTPLVNSFPTRNTADTITLSAQMGSAQPGATTTVTINGQPVNGNFNGDFSTPIGTNASIQNKMMEVRTTLVPLPGLPAGSNTSETIILTDNLNNKTYTAELMSSANGLYEYLTIVYFEAI